MPCLGCMGPPRTRPVFKDMRLETLFVLLVVLHAGTTGADAFTPCHPRRLASRPDCTTCRASSTVAVDGAKPSSSSPSSSSSSPPPPNHAVDEVDADGVDAEQRWALVLSEFVRYCRDTPVGRLEVGDAEKIRQAMEDLLPVSPVMFPPPEAPTSSRAWTAEAAGRRRPPAGGGGPGTAASDGMADNDDEDPAVTVEWLLSRLLEEWEDAVAAAADATGTGPSSISGTRGGNNNNNNNKDGREEAFRPTRHDFERAIGAWHGGGSSPDRPDAATRAFGLMSDQRELASRHNDDLPDMKPSLETAKVVLRTMAESRERGLDRLARAVLDGLETDCGVSPDADAHGLLVRVVARGRGRGAASRAEALLKEGLARFGQGTTGTTTPTGLDTAVFNAVVTAHAKGGEEDGPRRAKALIEFMERPGTPFHARPDGRTFTSLIDAYAQTNEWDSVQEAERIFNALLSRHLADEGGGEGQEDGGGLSQGLEPNVATWTIVIAAWARQSRRNRNGAARRAGNLLRRMEVLYSEGRITSGPDAVTYSTCMNAFASSKHAADVAEAERILDEMNELWLDGNDAMRPSPRSVRALVDAWIKAGNTENAKDVLDRYEAVIEDNPSADSAWWGDVYRAFLNGYSSQDDPRRATVYLNLMVEEEGMEPDSVCYDRIIEAYTRLGKEADCAGKAQEIFALMEQRRRIGAVVPTERIYTSFIRALTKGRVDGLHRKAELVLRRMKTSYEEGNQQVRPTIFAYNAVLNACAESSHVEGANNTEAFQTSVRIFTELRREADPDHVTFGTMLRCSDLLPPSEPRDRFISATFRLCCDRGFVNAVALRDLRRAASDGLWTSLTGLDPVNEEQALKLAVERLPRDWRRPMMEQKPNEKGRPFRAR